MDQYIHIIPEEAGFVPGEGRQRAAIFYFRKIARRDISVSVIVTAKLRFVHPGDHFGDIFCPSCKAQIEMSVWQGWMRADYQEGFFVLNQYVMPCCQARHTLHEIAYERPMGLTRCDIRATNPKIGKLPVKHRRRFEKLLGCRVRVIYERYPISI
jgi:hypothetical protein